jgi:hypothetical protein
MGMETLNSAARAAGFAMAVSDETPAVVEAKVEAQPWRSGEPVLVHHGAPAKIAPAIWLKSLLGLFHRRAPGRAPA